jgi:glutathione S-transferase
MAADLVIYGMKGSPFVRKVQVVLAEKGVPYEIEAVNIFPAPAWFSAINPAKRIPVLRDRSVGVEGVAGTIPDSSAICAYLERKHPEPALVPKDAFEHGRAIWFEEFADSELAALIGLNLFRVTVVQRLLGQEPDLERARRTYREKLPPLFDYLERELGDRAYLVGDAFSIADVAVATQVVNLHHAGGRVDPARWPRLAAFVERVHARESFAACIADERRMLAPSDWEL